MVVVYEDYNINIMKNVLPVVVTGIPVYTGTVGRGGGGSSPLLVIFFKEFTAPPLPWPLVAW